LRHRLRSLRIPIRPGSAAPIAVFVVPAVTGYHIRLHTVENAAAIRRQVQAL
jgi:hypothetical protein